MGITERNAIFVNNRCCYDDEANARPTVQINAMDVTLEFVEIRDNGVGECF